jgi:hypothetical protein
MKFRVGWRMTEAEIVACALGAAHRMAGGW